MKLKHLICVIAISTPLTATADFLSVSIGGGGWNDSATGTFQKTGDPAPLDVEKDLAWDSEVQGYYFATFEHFVPLVPNVRLMGTNVSHKGNGNTSFTFSGVPFTAPTTNDFKFNTIDLYAYYEILDNIVSLDIGLDIRKLKIDYTVMDGTNTVSDTVDKTIPMLYALVGASPWPGLILSGEISYVPLPGGSVSDMTAKIAYTTSFFVGFEAGYRTQKYELDDIASTNANLEFSGAFAGAYLKF